MDPVFMTAADAPAQIHVFTAKDWAEADLPAAQKAFAAASGFKAKAGQKVLLPDAEGRLADVLFGLGEAEDALGLAALSAALPAGDYELKRLPAAMPFAWAAAGWQDGAYRFTRYLKEPGELPRLLIPEAEDRAAIDNEARAARLLRDLVNTPAEHMGPDAIHAAVSDLAERFGARLEATIGDALLAANYPTIHAVGRAAAIPPRLLELTWGRESDPELALVGKGVSFDTGGLNLKVGNYMRDMKKDMGGAAHAIALAQLVMEADLPVRLRLLVPTVENAVSGNAFRPGDVIRTRKGVTVEIDNTDAEGRLILCDALARADELSPDLILDFATLTGAARVALGPDLAPFYTDDDDLAAAMERASEVSGDPVWRMPLWRRYRSMLSSSVADIANAGGPLAGSITAAVYLAEFVETRSWMHFDIWAWREGKYGRPAGAAPTGLRAAWRFLRERYQG